MDNNQELFITSSNSNYINELIQKKDWQALINFASSKYSYKSYLISYFETDESQVALSEMTEEQILALLDNAPSQLVNNILSRMESICDSHEKFTNIAVKLMTNVFLHGTDADRHLIVNILPIKIIRTIIDSRIPLTEYHFSGSKQEFFMYILSSDKSQDSKSYHYKNLKERDCNSGVYTYIESQLGNFPLGRREVMKELIKAVKDAFDYIDSNTCIDYKSIIVPLIINPLLNAISQALRNTVFDYENDKEIIDSLREVFDGIYKSKYFYQRAALPITQSSGNNSLFPDSHVLERCKVISPLYYYKVFKNSVELNIDNFVDNVARNFFNGNSMLKYVREMDDGVYDKIFNATIELTVRELIERKNSFNFEYCCTLLSHRPSKYMNNFKLGFDECLTFIKSVINKIFEKKEALNVDVSAYPEICLYMLRQLKMDELAIQNPGRTVEFQPSINQVYKNAHSPLDFIEAEMRNKLVIGVIRHPVDGTKFSSIIASNNPTKLVSYICDLTSVQDIKLVLPEAKRSTLTKYGFLQGRSAYNPKEACLMNIVEVFLHTLRFWENNDKSLFRDGYVSYYIFVRKILMEAIRTKDVELKKAAMTVYHRYSELVSLMKHAKYLNDRIQVASLTFLDPLAVIVGCELDKNFVKSYIEKYIQPFSAQSYQYILSEVISKSHIDMKYYDDENVDNEIDNIFKSISIDQAFAQATELLLGLIKQNPVKRFRLEYRSGKTEDFFISKERLVENIKSKFETFNPRILDVCNPLKTEYPVPNYLNAPNIDHSFLNIPQYTLSQLVYLQLAQYVNEESKSYSPKTFKTSSTQQTIQIQNIVTSVTKETSNLFLYQFSLDQPACDTNENIYRNQSANSIQVNYSPAFFEFLQEMNKNKESIYNTEAYEIVKGAFIAQFLSEEDALKQKNLPPPKFDGFPIRIQFIQHRNAQNIFNEAQYKVSVSDYKLNAYTKARNLNTQLINQINQSYNNSKKIGENRFDEIFTPDLSIHRSHLKKGTNRKPKYPINSHKCFTFIMDSLNKCQATSFLNDYDSLVMLENFKPIKKCGSHSNNYSMLTQLLDLLINEFVSTKANTTQMYKNRISTFDDVYKFMGIVTRIATPNIGHLENLQKLTTLTEKNVTEKIVNKNNKMFYSFFKNGNIDQILICMNTPVFTDNAENFYNYLLKACGQENSKKVVNSLINAIVKNQKQVNDDFLVALAKCSVYPYFVGFPVPQTNIEFLKKITTRSIAAKRAACANAIYYAIMNYTVGTEIPIKDIMEIIENAHKKLPDEITAFFCILISENASLAKMRSLPALYDLQIPSALPRSFVIQLGPELKIPKEIGQLYYNVVEKIILSGLKSKKSHIYELTVTVLNEINVGPEIQQIISPFIEKGLKEIEPSDDNEEFLRYATSFAMKNMNFKGCFDAYCEALSRVKKHSFAILKANKNIDANSAYPEPFRKLENSFRTINSTIEKPFNEFKEEDEMVSVSQFCRSILPILKQNRPAVARDVYLNLETYVSIFADELVEDVVHLYKQEKKEEALSKFLLFITRHEDLVNTVPSSISSIYGHLKSVFTVNHTIELSKNLAGSEYTVRLQNAYNLARMVSQEVLHHMPDAKNGSEDEIVEILSNLGIFCKANNVVYGVCETDKLYAEMGQMSISAINGQDLMHDECFEERADIPQAARFHARPMIMASVPERAVCEAKFGAGAAIRCSRRAPPPPSMPMAAPPPPSMPMEAPPPPDENICDFVPCRCQFNKIGAVQEECEVADDVEEVMDEDDVADEALEIEDKEEEGEDMEAIQDQIKDAFDIFS